VVSSSPEKLTLKAPDGAVLNARRMSPGYRLPF
jgi:hypothetical protein